jgi:hypothetical protein
MSGSERFHSALNVRLVLPDAPPATIENRRFSQLPLLVLKP